MITNNISWSLGPTPNKSLDPFEPSFPSHPSDPASPSTHAITPYTLPSTSHPGKWNPKRKIPEIPSKSPVIPQIPPRIFLLSRNSPAISLEANLTSGIPLRMRYVTSAKIASTDSFTFIFEKRFRRLRLKQLDKRSEESWIRPRVSNQCSL